MFNSTHWLGSLENKCIEPAICAFHQHPLWEKNMKFSEAFTLQAIYMPSGRPCVWTPWRHTVMLQCCQEHRLPCQDPGQMAALWSGTALKKFINYNTLGSFFHPVPLMDVPFCGDFLILGHLASMSLEFFRIQQISLFPTCDDKTLKPVVISEASDMEYPCSLLGQAGRDINWTEMGYLKISLSRPMRSRWCEYKPLLANFYLRWIQLLVSLGSVRHTT